MSRAPSDQAVRDRLLSELDTSFFLQAGAGAGKTRILVDRVVELVRRDHAQLRNIVAITFTEKAAGELRARIRTALSKARGGPADAAERRRLDDALRQVDAAHIETIHAFASSLLKERPFDAGIDPGFEILDALGADLDFTDAWHGWLWREEDPRAQAAIERALRFDMPLDRLREAAQQLSRNRDLDPPRGSPPPPDPHATHAEWLQTAEQLRVDYEQLGSKQAAQPETLVGWLREMPLDDPDELSRLLLTPERTRKPTGRSEALVALRARWDEFAAQRAAYARSLRAHILNDVLAVLSAFVRDDADRRRREGRLTFEDLLIEARNLLVMSAGARRFFRERYSHILIDEFQDTDPLQAEIVLLLAAEHDTNDWTNATPAPGRLLVVGDPQQAIYRFRRADIDTYTKVRRPLPAGRRRERRGHGGGAPQRQLPLPTGADRLVQPDPRPGPARRRDLADRAGAAPDPRAAPRGSGTRRRRRAQRQAGLRQPRRGARGGGRFGRPDHPRNGRRADRFRTA